MISKLSILNFKITMVNNLPLMLPKASFFVRVKDRISEYLSALHLHQLTERRNAESCSETWRFTRTKKSFWKHERRLFIMIIFNMSHRYSVKRLKILNFYFKVKLHDVKIAHRRACTLKNFLWRSNNVHT